MSIITRAEFNDLLSHFWGGYIARFEQLLPAEQQTFLEQQGYPSLPALLAHVMAWWQDGSGVVERMRADPSVRNPEYDIDGFNAEAVRRCAQAGEADMLAMYERQRRVMLELVNDLDEAELADERINTRLYYEIVQHANEHLLPE